MRTIEEVISTMPGPKVFSVLDAKSGFLQIELNEASSLPTTFNTPIGRCRCERPRSSWRPLNKLLSAHALLKNIAHNLDNIKCLLDEAKETQKLHYDNKRAAKTRRELQSEDEERIHILEVTSGLPVL